jgi:hypothetical protein
MKTYIVNEQGAQVMYQVSDTMVYWIDQSGKRHKSTYNLSTFGALIATGKAIAV